MFFSTLALMFGAMSFTNVNGQSVNPTFVSSTTNTSTYNLQGYITHQDISDTGDGEYYLFNSSINGLEKDFNNNSYVNTTYNDFFYAKLHLRSMNHYEWWTFRVQTSAFLQRVAPSFSYRLTLTFYDSDGNDFVVNISSRTLSSYAFSTEGVYLNEYLSTDMFGDIDTYVDNITFNLYLDFVYTLNEDQITGDSDAYASGYDTGLEVGYGDGYDSGYNVGSTDGYNTGYGDGYDEGFSTGKTVGFGEGYDNALTTHDFTFTNLFASISDTPILMIRRLFGFELFGVSLIAVFMSLFTALIIIKVIKKVF